MRAFRILAGLCLGAWLLGTTAQAADSDLLQKLEDRAEIEALVARYVTALDTLDAEMYAGVFAEDADFDVAGTKYHGRPEIATIVTSLKESRAAAETEGRAQPHLYHVMSNTQIELLGAESARHRSYWQTVRVGADNAVTVGAMGRYEDTLVKRGDRWLIRSRKIVPFTN